MHIAFPKGERGMKHRFEAARKKVLPEVGEKWHKEILPLHFRVGAERRYRYAKRTDAHMRRKSREGKPADPNVYTGRLRDKMTSTRPSMKLDREGITLTWRGLPRYTYVTDTYEWVTNDRRWDDEFLKKLDPKAQAGILRWREAHPETKDGRFKQVKRPDKRRELTAVNREDSRQMAKWAREALRREIGRQKRRRR